MHLHNSLTNPQNQTCPPNSPQILPGSHPKPDQKLHPPPPPLHNPTPTQMPQFCSFPPNHAPNPFPQTPNSSPKTHIPPNLPPNRPQKSQRAPNSSKLPPNHNPSPSPQKTPMPISKPQIPPNPPQEPWGSIGLSESLRALRGIMRLRGVRRVLWDATGLCGM